MSKPHFPPVRPLSAWDESQALVAQPSALSRLGASVFGMAVLALLCAGWLWWSQTRRLDLDQQALDFEARMQGLHAVARAPAASAAPQVGELLQQMQGQLLGTKPGDTLGDRSTLARQGDAGLSQAAQVLGRARLAVLQRPLSNWPQIEPALQTAHGLWLQALARQRQHQQRMNGVGLALFGVASLALLWRMRRAQQATQALVAQLQAQEAELSAFAQALPDLAFRLDAQGRCLAVYGRHLPLLGPPAASLLGRTVEEVFPRDMARRFEAVIRAALDSGQAQPCEFSLPSRSGRRHFDSRCAPVKRLQEVVWTVWDISARRQVEHRLRRKTRMYDFMRHVNQAIVRSDNTATLLQRVCEVAIQHGQFRRAWMVLAPQAHGEGWRCAALAGDALPTRECLSFGLPTADVDDGGLLLALQQGLVWRTAALQDSAWPWVAQAREAGIAGCVVVPLRRESTLVGHLLLLGRRVDDQDDDEFSLFEDLSGDLSFALTGLHRESLHNEAEERIRLHAAALESTRDGMMVLDRDRLLVSVNPAFTALTGYSEAEVVGRSPAFLFTEQAAEILTEVGEHLLSYGSWQAEVWFRHRCGDPFVTKLSVSAVHSANGEPDHFVGVFTDITQLKQTEASLARMAHFDPLTELPNRVTIHQRLALAISLAQRHHTLVGVVFIDLDNFKTVNDGLGHAAGDSLLRQVAHRLRQRVREEDTLGRLGGDEFVLVLEHLRHPQQAAHVATAILETLNQPFILDDSAEVYVRASIGISLYPHDGADESELVRNADAAMYDSKRRGRNSLSFYTQAFTSEAIQRLQLETLLRKAVAQQEFRLLYQPMVRLRDHQVIAVEALVRLEPGHAALLERQMGPSQFIPVMENTGMISSLSDWVLEQACRQARAWLQAGLDFGRVAINLSPSEIRRGGVVERLSAALRKTGLPPKHLEIEITESGLMESGMGAEVFLQALHELGVVLTIDDFGTGYSSLAYLKRFPVQQLKIDRSFVQDLPGNDSDSQLVSTMITMAHGLKLHVVAEGVEMPDQEAFLVAHGCDVAQGFLYSRPVPPSSLEAMLRSQSPA